MVSRWWSWGWQDVNENGRANPIPPASLQYWDNYEYSAQLTAFPQDVDIVQVAAAETSGAGVDAEGNVWVWGQGRFSSSPVRNVFGDAINSLPTYPSVAPPFMLPYPEAVDAVEVTITNRGAVFWRNTSGEVYGVGYNRDGEFGLGEAAGTYHGTPVKLTTLPDAIVHIFAWVDGQGLFAIDSAGAVWYAGYDRYGMSGSGVIGTSTTRVLTFATIGGAYTPDTSVQPEVVASGSLAFNYGSSGDADGFWAFGSAGTISSFTVTGDLPTLVVVLSSADAYNPSYYGFSLLTPSSEFLTLTNDADASAGVPGSPNGFVAAWTLTDERVAAGGTLFVSHWIFDPLTTGTILRNTIGVVTWAGVDGGPEVHLEYWGAGETPGAIPASQPTVPGSTPKAIILSCIGQASTTPVIYLDPAAVGWELVNQGISTPANRRSAIASQLLTASGSWPGVMTDFADAVAECWSATDTKTTVLSQAEQDGFGAYPNSPATGGSVPDLLPGETVFTLYRPDQPENGLYLEDALAKAVQPNWVTIRTAASVSSPGLPTASIDVTIEWWAADGTYAGGTGMLDECSIITPIGPNSDSASNPVQHAHNNSFLAAHGGVGWVSVSQAQWRGNSTVTRPITITVEIDCAVTGGSATTNSFNIGIYSQAPVTTTPLLGVQALAMTERPFSDGVSSGASTFALMADGTIMFWGRSMTESPALNVAYVPTVVPDIAGIKEIYGSDGNECVYFLTEDGVVLGLGTDNDGALCNGAFDVDDPTWYLEEDHFALPPVTIAIPGDKEVLHLARGSSFTTMMMVVTTDGELWGWGYNSGTEWGYSDPNPDVVEKVPPQRVYPNYFNTDDDALQVVIMMENAVFVERAQHSFGLYHGLDDTGGYTYDGCHVRWGFPNGGDSDANWDNIPGGRDNAWGVMAPPEETSSVFAYMLRAPDDRPEEPSDTERRLFVSDDTGLTWTLLPDGPWLANAEPASTQMAARSRTELYMLAEGPFGTYKIYKSIDGGETWEVLIVTRNATSLTLSPEKLWWVERARTVQDTTHVWPSPFGFGTFGSEFTTWDVRRSNLDGTLQELVWSQTFHGTLGYGFALRGYTGGDEWVLGAAETGDLRGRYFRITRPIKSYAGTFSTAAHGTSSPVNVLGTPTVPLIWSPSVQPMDQVQLRAEITTVGSSTLASRFDIYFTNNSLTVVGTAQITAYATPAAPGQTPLAVGMFPCPATGQRFYVQHTTVGGSAPSGREATIEVVFTHWQTEAIGPPDRPQSVSPPVVAADYAPGQLVGDTNTGLGDPNSQGFAFMAAMSMRRGWTSATWRIWQEPQAGWPVLNWEAVLVFTDGAYVNLSPHTFSELKVTVPSSGATADYSTTSLSYDMDAAARDRIEQVMLFGRPTGTYTGNPRTTIKVNIYSYTGLARPDERQWDILPLSASTYVALNWYERVPGGFGMESFRAMIARTDDYGATWTDQRMLVGHETPTAFSTGSSDGMHQIAAPRLNGQQEIYIVGGVGQDGLPPAGDAGDPESSSPLVTWHSQDLGLTWVALYHESMPVDTDKYFMFYGPRTIDGGPRVVLRGCGPVLPGGRRRRPWVAG